MKVVDLKGLVKERGLRGYSKFKKADLIAFIQDNLQPPAPRARPPRPNRPPPPQPSVRFRPDRPRQPELLRQLDERQDSSREMDIFEQQEMNKNRPQVTSKRNDWYDFLVNHVPKTIKDKASRAFKTFTNKVVGLYNGFTGNEDQILKPYQLRHKRGKKTLVEPPMEQPPNQKQTKHMKKNLYKLNKKILQNNWLISKRHSLRKRLKN